MSARRLEVVTPSELPDPPYPADVRARGWGFVLDVERLENSDTWTLATADMRPWLLMLWMRAWTQTPCGSLPAEDQLIAARIGMELRSFNANRDILLRGWQRCSDGRLYHPVVTELVEKMRDGRRAEREKKARQRANVPGDTTGNPKGVHVESPVCPPTGTGTGAGTGTGERDTPSRKRSGAPAGRLVSESEMVAAGVDPQVALDWLTVRKVKKLPLTPTAWAGVIEQAAKAGMPVGDAVRTSVINGWGGFKADWMQRPDAQRLPTGAAANWWETSGGIKAKGAELGVPYTRQDECQPWQAYAARVFKAAGHSPRAAA